MLLCGRVCPESVIFAFPRNATVQIYKKIMKRALRALLVTVIFQVVSGLALSAAATDPYKAYIDRYAALAVEHRERYGIPAAITLSQGLLESGAGRSTLATRGNNHFGIKCHSTWKGDTLLRSDDAPDECFRSYATPEESFADHSRFLKQGKRYQSLFAIPVEDYRGWAQELSRCGYATDPNYAARLVSIIERYGLAVYDAGGTTLQGEAVVGECLPPSGGEDDEDLSQFIFDQLRSRHIIRLYRKLNFVIATPGDTYASIAREFEMDPRKLMAYNEVDKDGEITPWQEVYLQPKLDKAPRGMRSIVIGEEETLFSVAQRLGMTLESIKALNPGSTFQPGSRLRLR